MRSYLLALPLCVLISACAPHNANNNAGYYKVDKGATPQALAFEYEEQLSVESARHWRHAARDLVFAMRQDYADVVSPIYVEPTFSEDPFTHVFDNFLRQALIESGYSVAARPGYGPVLRYKSTVVDHRAPRSGGDHPALGLGMESRAGESDSWSKDRSLSGRVSEVVVTSTLTEGGSVLSEQTEVFYIRRDDIDHYAVGRSGAYRMRVSGE